MSSKYVWCEKQDGYVIGITCAMCDRFECNKRRFLVNKDVVNYMLSKGYKRNIVLFRKNEKRNKSEKEFVFMEGDFLKGGRAKRVKVINKFELHIKFSLVGKEYISYWKGIKPPLNTKAFIPNCKESFKIVDWDKIMDIVGECDEYPIEIWSIREVKRQHGRKSRRNKKANREANVRARKCKEKIVGNKKEKTRNKEGHRSNSKGRRDSKGSCGNSVKGFSKRNKRNSE